MIGVRASSRCALCRREIVKGDERDPYTEINFGRIRRPDSNVVDWANKVLFVLEFTRTSD
jgi:hypothetical protein